jgi:hypothetical protein
LNKLYSLLNLLFQAQSHIYNSEHDDVNEMVWSLLKERICCCSPSYSFPLVLCCVRITHLFPFYFVLFQFCICDVFDKMLLLILFNIGSYDAKRQSKMFSELNWCFDIVISNLCFYLSFSLYFFVQWQTRRSWIGSVAFEVYY